MGGLDEPDVSLSSAELGNFVVHEEIDRIAPRVPNHEVPDCILC